VASQILTALGESAEPLSEPEIEERVKGRTAQKRRALRQLVGAGTVVRLGTGRRGRPYRYKLPNGLGADLDKLDTCSLVPKKTTEQERDRSTAENLDSVSRPDVSPPVLPPGEQANEKLPTRPVLGGDSD